jgi:hypothetical protein
MVKRCQIPADIPKAKPASINHGELPQRSSSHFPPNPGNTISTASAAIRPTHSAATVMGCRSSDDRGTPTTRLFIEISSAVGITKTIE